MTAKVITVTNQKGGAGKSTLTMQLAGTFALNNKVMVIDADPQATATRWASSSPDDHPFPATICGLGAAGGKVHREVKKYLDDYDYIFIDTPPAVDSPVPQSALMVSDLALIPIIPSPPDLWAGIAIKELIERMNDFNDSLKTRLVINMCQSNTTIARDIISIVEEFGIAKTSTSLVLRTAYRQSAAFGCTVNDMKKIAGSSDDKAIREINKLKKEIESLL
ncbi:ParA family partition ATPase [Cysteiniphilum halobium]|uniref:ParA family partition ATPase n=1 Tax=Cysteiniphilum halobium TaxID=2219059 RepID=UPI000E65E658|nr:ParA family partition ATPase [Cysteiniphilum halobium]